MHKVYVPELCKLCMSKPVPEIGIKIWRFNICRNITHSSKIHVLFFLRLVVLRSFYMYFRWYFDPASNAMISCWEVTFYRMAEDITGALHHLRNWSLLESSSSAPPPTITSPTLLLMGNADPALPLDTGYKSLGNTCSVKWLFEEFYVVCKSWIIY